jgi:hypothetical protein
VSIIREFTTAAREAEPSGDDPIEFVVDGHECICYKPQASQFAVLMASISRQSDWPTQVAGVINFFASVLDQPSHAYLTGRLLDREDPFGIEQVQEIIEWMVEEWTGRPTQSPSGSTQSRPSGGPRSMQPTHKSTSSPFPRTDSAISSTAGASSG